MEIYPAYNSKYNTKHEKQITLLMIPMRNVGIILQ